MQIGQVYFKNSSSTVNKDGIDKNISTPLNTNLPADKVEISTKQNKKSTFEKITLGFLASSTVIGIGAFIFRKNIAKLLKPEPKPILPTKITIKDDTIEQAISYLVKDREKLNSKTEKELQGLLKYAKEDNIEVILNALYTKTEKFEPKQFIQIFEPIVDYFFKNDKLTAEKRTQIVRLANMYNLEKMAPKAYELLLKADKKWADEPYLTFKDPLARIYADNKQYKNVIEIWEEANKKDPPKFDGTKYGLIPVLESYTGVKDYDSVVKIFKNNKYYYSESLTNMYINAMLKKGMQKDLINDLVTHIDDEPYLIKYISENLNKFKFNTDTEKSIKITEKLMKIRRELPLWTSNTKIPSKALGKFKSFINEVSGKFMPEEEANKLLDLIEKMPKTTDKDEYIKLVDDLYTTKWLHARIDNPIYQKFIENLKNNN